MNTDPHRVARLILIATGFAGALLVAVPSLNAGGALQLRVTPTMTRSPALITARVMLDTVADDRYLQVAAESEDYYTSSQVQLDGSGHASVRVVEFRNLPTGLYQITAVLVGTHGPRASAMSLARVAPSPGAR